MLYLCILNTWYIGQQTYTLKIVLFCPLFIKHKNVTYQIYVKTCIPKYVVQVGSTLGFSHLQLSTRNCSLHENSLAISVCHCKLTKASFA